jgi:hypothetical protein
VKKERDSLGGALRGLDFELLHLGGGLLALPPQLALLQLLLLVRILDLANLLLDLATLALALLLGSML